MTQEQLKPCPRIWVGSNDDMLAFDNQDDCQTICGGIVTEYIRADICAPDARTELIGRLVDQAKDAKSVSVFFGTLIDGNAFKNMWPESMLKLWRENLKTLETKATEALSAAEAMEGK